VLITCSDCSVIRRSYCIVVSLPNLIVILVRLRQERVPWVYSGAAMEGEKSFRLLSTGLSWPEYRHCQSDACREGTCAHHLLDVVDPQEVYTSRSFKHDAIQAINTIPGA